MRDKIEYIVMLVGLFAKRFHLSRCESLQYLSTYGGLDLADKHYRIMHTLPFNDQIEAVVNYSRRNGGKL